MIPLLRRAGVSRPGTAAAILGGTFGSMLSPGLSHNAYVAKMANLDVIQTIGVHMNYTLVCGAISMIGVTIMCILLGDYKPGSVSEDELAEESDVQRVNILKALAPLVPVLILVTGNLWIPAIKMGVAQAMIVGAIYTLAVTLSDPQAFSKRFFAGMGNGYGEVLGIIIAAGVFAAGLKASGLIAVFIEVLRGSNEIVRWVGACSVTASCPEFRYGCSDAGNYGCFGRGAWPNDESDFRCCHRDLRPCWSQQSDRTDETSGNSDDYCRHLCCISYGLGEHHGLRQKRSKTQKRASSNS